MNDQVWFFAVGIVLAVLGIIFIWLGLTIRKKQRIDLIIRYHMDKVREYDKPAYCRLSGLGMSIIGIGFIISGICIVLSGRLTGFVPVAIFLVAGIALLLSAVFKYNR